MILQITPNTNTKDNNNIITEKNETTNINLDYDISDYISMPAFAELEMYLTPQEVSELLNCSLEEANNFMKRSDFPVIDLGQSRRVNRLALLKYSQMQRV